jgi:valyl-tRNA synthetase
MVEPWPHIQEQVIDKKLEKQAQSIFEIITQIRNLRSSIEIKPEQKVKVSFYPHTKFKHKLIQDNSSLIINLAKLDSLEILHFNKRPKATISQVAEDVDVYLHFSGLLDISGEQKKLREKIISLEKSKKDKGIRIRNREFIKKAPREVIEKEKEGIAKLKDELKRLNKMCNELR